MSDTTMITVGAQLAESIETLAWCIFWGFVIQSLLRK